MALTPIQLRFAALRETGVVGLLKTPTADQDQKAQECYAGLHAQLIKDRIATWAVTESIPSAVQQAMTWALAFACAPSIGADPSEIARLAPLGAYGVTPQSVAERALRKNAASRYVSQPATSEYF